MSGDLRWSDRHKDGQWVVSYLVDRSTRECVAEIRPEYKLVGWETVYVGEDQYGIATTQREAKRAVRKAVKTARAWAVARR